MCVCHKVIYAILAKHFIRFYTQIRYALPWLFHMWKPTLPPDIQGHFHPKIPRLASPAGRAVAVVGGETVMRV